MNIHFRIVKVDTAAHGILIRYWTDKLSEMDLASRFDDNGKPLLNSDGYPVQTRTDSFMTIYEVPAPSVEEINKRIMMQAPVEWLKLQESVVDPTIDTKLVDVKNVVGTAVSFNEEKVAELKAAVEAELQAARSNTRTSGVTSISDAYDIVSAITQSINVLSVEDPEVIGQLANTLSTIIT